MIFTGFLSKSKELYDKRVVRTFGGVVLIFCLTKKAFLGAVHLLCFKGS